MFSTDEKKPKLETSYQQTSLEGGELENSLMNIKWQRRYFSLCIFQLANYELKA